MSVPTKPFVVAVVEGIQALRLNAKSMAEEPQYKGDDGVGRILRHRVKTAFQHADVLAGWVKRNAPAAGINPEEFDI